MMTNTTLYDDDILLWSEQQAAAIRRLAQSRNLPNELDVENVAEEIESVGRSELAAVKSCILLIFVHFIKLAADSNATAARHWRSEIVGFHTNMMNRYAASMRQRIDIDALWRSARQQLLLAYEGEPQQGHVAALPGQSPFSVDDLVTEEIDSAVLVARLQAFASSSRA
jgi:hypothetical protein